MRKKIRKIEIRIFDFEKKAKASLNSLFESEARVLASTLISFTHFQLKVRPRARIALKALVVLLVALVGSTYAVSYLENKQDEIKINGQAILVAEDNTSDVENAPEIVQSVNALRSPFLMEKPIDGHVSQGFSSYHRALDITSPVGTPIKPVGPGIVEFAGYTSDGKGNVVVVDHGDGLKTLYAHMGKVYVGVGNMVNPGSSLGGVGLTGRTTGAHVHFEVIDNGALVNPGNLL